MLAAMVLAAVVVTGPAFVPPAPMAVPVVPPEPGAMFLPEAPTYQAVAADLDGDAAREVIRLVLGDRSSIAAEVWTQRGDAWEPVGSPLEIIPGRSNSRTDLVYAGTPARLLVRHADGADHVTVVTQPRYEQPGAEDACCLILDDIAIEGDAVVRVSVAQPGPDADAVSVIDLDGDGTDELLASRSLPPLGGVTYPSEARVYRWAGVAFARPTVTQLSVGSGDSPFVLGDSDGVPGEEAGIIATVGGQTLLRLSLGEGDEIHVEDSGLFASEARAVPIAGGGLAIISRPADVVVVQWPRDDLPSEPLGQVLIPAAHLLGTVDADGGRRLLVRQGVPNALHALLLPGLISVRATGLARSPAAAAFASGPVQPFAGPLPGGGPDGEEAAIVDGRLIPSATGDGAPFPTGGTRMIAALPGAEPIGLVGRDRAWMALLHSPLPAEPLDPRGGRLDAPAVEPGSGVSLAPLARIHEPEAGELEAPISGAEAIDGRGTLAVGANGFVAHVQGPPGSRIYVAEADPSVLGAISIIPASGAIDVSILPAPSDSPNGRQRAGFAVVTPAGHGYIATWELRLLTAAPELEARVATPFGSPFVVITGESAPYASVTVNGLAVEVASTGQFRAEVALPPWPTDVSVVATDPIGNQAAMRVSGVGLFDYRALPWVPISVLLVVAAAALLFLRVPRSREEPRSVADDGVLEEIEPD